MSTIELIKPPEHIQEFLSDKQKRPRGLKIAMFNVLTVAGLILGLSDIPHIYKWVYWGIACYTNILLEYAGWRYRDEIMRFIGDHM